MRPAPAGGTIINSSVFLVSTITICEMTFNLLLKLLKIQMAIRISESPIAIIGIVDGRCLKFLKQFLGASVQDSGPCKKDHLLTRLQLYKALHIRSRAFSLSFKLSLPLQSKMPPKLFSILSCNQKPIVIRWQFMSVIFAVP